MRDTGRGPRVIRSRRRDDEPAADPDRRGRRARRSAAAQAQAHRRHEHALVVAYRVGGTAQSGVDYEALPGTIEIPAKKKSATIVVRPLADGLLEGPDTIEVELVPNDAFAPGAVSSATIELLSKDE